MMINRQHALTIAGVLTMSASLTVCGGSSTSKTSTAAAPTAAASASRTSAGATTTAPAAATSAATMTLTSDALANNATIPTQFTCAGASLQPPLRWSGAPSATKAFTLLMEDTDVPGIFDHWVVYDVPASVNALDSQPPATGGIAGGKQGQTARGGSMMYIGPCPPVGASPHHYRFRVYALDAALGLPAGAAKADLLAAMQGHIIAQGELVGLFSR